MLAAVLILCVCTSPKINTAVHKPKCWLLKLCLIWIQNFGTYTAQKLAQLGRKIAQACLQCLSLFASPEGLARIKKYTLYIPL